MTEELIAPKTPAQSQQRLQALLQELEQRGLAGLLVPRTDEHQGEYVPPRAQRLAWLTGFTGSAGLAIVYRQGSAIFVDGRYTLQVRDQVDTALFEPQHLMNEPPRQWLATHLQAGDRIGFDPWLHTLHGLESLRQGCAQAGAELVACDSNPLDAVWADQPEAPLSPAVPHPLRYAGEDADSKRQRLAQTLQQEQIDTAVLTLPDSIAWLLNIRGTDVAHNPVALSFALLHKDSHVELFMDERKISAGLREHLGNGVSIQPPERFQAALQALTDKTVRADSRSAPAWVFEQLQQAGAQITPGADPCVLPKARKNPVELEGARAAHQRDGVALCRFFHWLADNGGSGTLDELGVAEHLQTLRADTGKLQDLSFDTISGAGSNGAIVHYRVTPATNKKLVPGSIYLVDSGAQYLDGTTDVTRAVFIGDGAPSAEQRDRFTRVLKGHIQLARARFPQGTTGSQLDTLARYALWQAGLDFDHGTGHGVGSYLSVHEGPQRISKVASDIALEPGMIISNEPGYYKTGAYGIRMENLVAVTEPQAIPGGERLMLGFETLTLAPIDLALVEPGLLTQDETDWLNAYHRRVLEAIGPQLDAAAQSWLQQATRAL